MNMYAHISEDINSMYRCSMSAVTNEHMCCVLAHGAPDRDLLFVLDILMYLMKG